MSYLPSESYVRMTQADRAHITTPAHIGIYAAGRIFPKDGSGRILPCIDHEAKGGKWMYMKRAISLSADLGYICRIRSPDPSRVLVGVTQYSGVQIYNVAQTVDPSESSWPGKTPLKPIFSIEGHPDSICPILANIVTPNSSIIVSCSSSGYPRDPRKDTRSQIMLSDATDGSTLGTLSHSVSAIELTAGSDRNLWIHQLVVEKVLGSDLFVFARVQDEVPAEEACETTSAFSHLRRKYIPTSGFVTRIDVERDSIVGSTYSPQKSDTFHRQEVNSASIDSTQQVLYTSDSNHAFRLFDLRANSFECVLHRPTFPRYFRPDLVHFSRLVNMLLIGGSSGYVYVFDPRKMDDRSEPVDKFCHEHTSPRSICDIPGLDHPCHAVFAGDWIYLRDYANKEKRGHCRASGGRAMCFVGPEEEDLGLSRAVLSEGEEKERIEFLLGRFLQSEEGRAFVFEVRIGELVRILVPNCLVNRVNFGGEE